MVSLAGLRYRDVLAKDGGPIERLEISDSSAFGERCFMANAWVRSDLIKVRRALTVYGSADGSGTHTSPLVARYMAISEALERWAYHDCVHSADAGRYGFDLDPTSNGMAAFPGVRARAARRAALFEAIERASLFDWWEGRVAGELLPTPWPGVHAIQIPNPLGIGVTVVTFSECEPDCFAYGHATGASFRSACARSVVEMQRSAYVLRHHQAALAAGRCGSPTDRFERRCVFFSTPEGHAVFQERVARGVFTPYLAWRIACDCEVNGPWSRYANIWRVLIPRPIEAVLGPEHNYFFW